MKSLLKYLAGPLVVVFLFIAASWNRQEQTVTVDEGNALVEYSFAGLKPEQKTYARDTISAATSTTVAVPWIMASPYQYNYYVRLRKIGVTPNVKVVLQEANSTGSTLWYPIDSFSCSGADSVKVNFLLRGATTYGARHRLLFTKTGTGAVQRDIILNIKPTDK